MNGPGSVITMRVLEKNPRPDSRVNDLCRDLREMAHQRGPNIKLPTTRELCTSLNTNAMTLSNALRRLERDNVIYRRQGSGIFVSPKLHCKNIRVLMNAMFVDADGVSPFWGILW